MTTAASWGVLIVVLASIAYLAIAWLASMAPTEEDRDLDERMSAWSAQVPDGWVDVDPVRTYPPPYDRTEEEEPI